MATVDVSISERIATITFNRPTAMNALNTETLNLFSAAVHDLADRKDVSVVIVTGEGEKAFVAGADIKQMQEMSPLQASRFAQLGQSCLFALERLPMVTIAAVNGFALGGGCEIAMACDLIYACEKAKFGQPEVSIGVIPGFGGTQRLLRLVGPMKGREMVYTGGMIKAEEAKEVGLVAGIFPCEKFMDHIREVAQTIMTKGPEALRRAKLAMREGYDIDLERACSLEREQFALCFAHPDQKEGMQAFLEKRKPNWKG